MALPFDEVVLTLGGEAIKIYNDYEIKAGVITQPAAFSMRLGHGGTALELLKRFPPNTPFTLTVNGVKIQTGFTDARASGDGSGATEATFSGRDVLAKLVDGCILAEQSFAESTYLQLVQKGLAAVGLAGAPVRADNTANRRAITGVQTQETQPAEVEVTFFPTGEQVIRDVVAGTTKTVYKTIKAEVGRFWYEFLKEQLERAGLFLWAAGDGTFVISVPNGNQTPAYRITRIKRGERGVGRVISHSFTDDIKARFSRYRVYGRGGGRNLARAKIQGQFVDTEIAALLGGEDNKVLVLRDNKITTIKQADLYARRRAAEAARAGWQLSYTLSGHSTPSPLGGRAVWAPDTVVEVDDRELGIKGNFYVESVAMRRNPHTTTTVNLMKPEHLVFALEA